jgi:cyclic beta-1,2-glucan synthetase
VLSYTGDRNDFLGVDGSRKHPQGLARARLSGDVGRGLSPCGALHVQAELASGATETFVFVLGDASDRNEALAAATRHAQRNDWDALFERAQAAWNDLLGRVQVSTPDPALDIMVNRWLLYQTLSCRIWGRSAFYQSGGAYGYRDQLQDVLALLHARPQVAREHILRAAARQFKEGDVQHWWHPETGEGVRTHCSDDMLWLPFATMHYVRVTGDDAILDETAPFLDERTLLPNEHDLYSVPRVSQEVASLYEHCRRALVVATTHGAHGIPLMLGGDWNDGMDHVGAARLGESIWLGWFLASIWSDFATLARTRGDLTTFEQGKAEVARISEALDAHGWDGGWYRRAFADDGSLLGSKESLECRIDAIAQSWSVISGVADPERARKAVDASLAQLVKPDPGMMLLLTPPFTTNNPHDPGYIRSYPAGIRENGGQYTHGVLWTVQALAQLGDGERAYSLLSMLNPVHHGQTRAAVDRYKAEPYVVAADVYAGDHLGRAGWTWYTGAAGWMYRIALEELLGLHVRGDTLSLVPRVPRAWKAYSIRYQRGETTFFIEVENPQGLELTVAELEVTIDGKPVQAARIPLPSTGTQHTIRARVCAAATRERVG